jgi:pimeloyl-ACP methyl ester carboxylesterase
MSYIRKLAGSGEVRVSGVRRFRVAMLVSLLVATQAMGGNTADQELTQSKSKGTVTRARNSDPTKIHGYAPVNGLKMYYEIEGTGDPLVYIPPVFGFAGLKSFPALTQNHKVITMDLQGRGRTADIPERPLSIEQYANDVVGLLKYLGISKADFFGESYGGNTAAMIAARHPELVGRVATYGATFGPPQIAINSQVGPSKHPAAESRYVEFDRESYKKVAPDPDYWPKIFEKVDNIQWGGFSKDELASIEAPILIIVGDHDFVRLEHAVETFKVIPNAELAVVPDASHFVLFSEQERVIPVVKYFLEKPEKRLPLGGGTGYHPGETR